VVAEEVRNLAQRSAESAKDTAELIDLSQSNANEGVVVTGEVTSVLGEIVEGVSRISLLIDNVSQASGEQSRGVSDISNAVGQLDNVTQSNAANAEESASASEELSGQARELNVMVGVLSSIVNGGNGPTGSSLTGGSIPKAKQRRSPVPASFAPARQPAQSQDWNQSSAVIPLDEDEMVEI